MRAGLCFQATLVSSECEDGAETHCLSPKEGGNVKPEKAQDQKRLGLKGT